MADTNIEWADSVWNPVTGCTKVSAGCKNCYAEGVAHRFWAKQYPPTVVDVDGAKIDRPRRFTDVRTHEDRLDEPLRWRKPRRVFVNSMSDLFHDAVPDAFLDRVFGVMQEAAPWVHQLGAHGFELQPPRHTFLILTKRPERMRDYILDAGRRGVLGLGLPPSIWLGVSCEDQKTADERIPLLLQTPAAVRFVSCEPLLGHVDVTSFLHDSLCNEHRREAGCICSEPREAHVDWLICGGESGPGARPCDVQWLVDIREQCKAAARVACFIKQVGANVRDRNDVGFEAECERIADGPNEGQFTDRRAWPTPRDVEHNPNGFREEYQGAPVRIRLHDPKGGDMEEWPLVLRVRDFPRGGARV